ncbi:MAG: AFG1 family ATPase [Alphaproteobacteria bacterium]|nr:AFG1 family ATPase [Alphaproteobacteria bacterium]
MTASAYITALAQGELKPDAAQAAAAAKLQKLANALKPKRFLWFGKRSAPKGLYIWGDVGRGKTMLMDLFFEDAPEAKKQRRHFNAFMTDIHARIHAMRLKGVDDPIVPVARAIAREVRLLCFDEFQVTDVADAMILGRLFEQFFAAGMVIVATSNTAPEHLYEGGLNRQLFLPFIDAIKARMEVVSLKGPTDYRLQGLRDVAVYLMPLSQEADAAMDAAWGQLAGGAGKPASLAVLGRTLAVPRAGRGAARFNFDELCARPLGVADYLAVAQNFHTVFIDHIPVMDETRRNEARRFILLIDTLYDEGVKLVCSAAAAPDGLYPAGSGSDAFRRTASRLAEMQSEGYLAKGHGVHAPHASSLDGLGMKGSA